ncbi:MAG: polyprenyl synthetase family protein [Verrucomicrobiota bacterium]
MGGTRMDFATQLSAHVARIERGLADLVPAATTRPTRLHTAMRYSLEAGGKRLRPVLVLAASELFGNEAKDPMAAAVAIECLHTYSLIHDDLPCMDNDDLRRGRPTAHRQFDEATALLAGDALLTQAFALLVENYSDAPALATALVRELADAAGSRRLIGGQMEDLLAEKKSNATPDELEFIHLNKTAAMIEAALVMGGLVGLGARAARPYVLPNHPKSAGEPPALPPELATLRTAGRHLGLAFQIMDDVLDATADTATLGKTAGKDAKAGKTTFVKLHGLAAARARADKESAAAIAEFRKLPGRAPFLVALTEQMQSRKR